MTCTCVRRAAKRAKQAIRRRRRLLLLLRRRRPSTGRLPPSKRRSIEAGWAGAAGWAVEVVGWGARAAALCRRGELCRAGSRRPQARRRAGASTAAARTGGSGEVGGRATGRVSSAPESISSGDPCVSERETQRVEMWRVTQRGKRRRAVDARRALPVRPSWCVSRRKCQYENT